MSVAIVGATGAIGSSIARRVLARGGTPWLIGRNADALQSLSQTLNGAPFTVADARQAEQLGDALAPDLPADLKGFAYCAGDIALKPFKRAEPADFRACFELHVVGAAAALRSVEAPLKKNGGSVVLFSSVAVQQGFTNHAIISSAKGAIEGMTRALAAEFAPSVRVNAIAPSISHSAMAAPMLGKESMRNTLAKSHPLGRVGEADDSAALASFLLSDEAGWVTGQVIGVDGGRAAVA
eukprot:CAMPEP_0196689530 /NCGR_PEP_ID=MMETSP1090-20130531/18375_1 /TAXON_ID=37098 /ORGANISM="Isochrysis sp, Strain CCMP1244" /LENGTH=237 /DNA_ID=CAMNT_0042028539 /DNA_START=30 /DNA_END=743 /DNA_ORIENTATION=+